MKIDGISRGHNASVCLINDGKIEFYVEEERLIRSKYDWEKQIKDLKNKLSKILY